MECDDCGWTMDIDVNDYLKQKEATGTVVCTDCRNSVLRRVNRFMRGEAVAGA